MSVIIRLQNLPWSANSMDIRNYFQGLSIPEGGVHIVGGEQGDAFIAFSTDEDARQAMMNDGGKIKEVKIKLLLSSRNEMQKVIEQARQTSMSFQNIIQAPTANPVPAPTQQPPMTMPPMTMMAQMGMANHPLLAQQQAAVGLAQQLPPTQNFGQNPIQQPPQPQENNSMSQTNNLAQQALAQKDWQGMPMGMTASGIPGQVGQMTIPGLMPGMPPHLSMMGMMPAQFAQMAQMGLLGPNMAMANFFAQQKPSVMPAAALPNPTPPTSETKQPDLQMLPNVHPVFSQAPSNQFQQSVNQLQQVQTPEQQHPIVQQAPEPPVITPSDRELSRNSNDDVKIVSETTKDTKKSTKSRSSSRERRRNDRDRSDRKDRDRRRRSRTRSRSRERRRRERSRERRSRERKTRKSRSKSRERNRTSKTQDRNKPTDGVRKEQEENHLPGPNKSFTVLTPNLNLVPPSVHVPFSNIDTKLKMPDMKTPFSSNNTGAPAWTNNSNPKFPEPVTCIEVRNVPSHIRYVDIKSFFHYYPLYHDGIKIINDKSGKRTGIVYVRCLKSESRERALKDLNGKYLLDSQVELFPIDDEIFEKAVDSFRPSKAALIQENQNAQPPILTFKILNLPEGVKREEITEIFGNFELDTIRVNREDASRIMAFVKIKNDNDARQFISTKKIHTVGDKPVLVVPCFDSEFSDAVKKFPDEPDPIKTNCILIKNLPKQTSDRDVCDFFSDIALVPLKIHIMFTAEGEASGDVFCEFASPEEANQAVTKNETAFGRNTVSVLLVTRQTLIEALGPPLSSPPKMMSQGLLGLRPQAPNIHPEHMEQNFRNGPGLMGNGGGNGHPIRYNGPPSGFNGPPSLFDPMGPRNDRYSSPYERGRGGMRGRGGRGRGYGYGGGFDDSPRGNPHRGPPNYVEEDVTTPENFGKPGCVLALENIPYRATMDDILNFFHDFELTRENIIRRYDEEGRPTGDARVCLVSPSEAQRAFHQLSRQYIQSRMIHISPV